MKNFLLLLLAVTALSSPPIAVAETPHKLRVGLILPLSGPVAAVGEQALKGFSFEIAASLKERLEIFVEDDQFDPKRSVAAFERLVSTKQIEVILIIGSGPSNAVAPLAQAKQIPLLALAGDPQVSRDRDHVVRLRITGEAEGRLVGAEMKRNGAQRAVLVCAQNEYTLSVCAGVKESLGNVVVHTSELLPQEADFRSLVSLLREKHADAVFVGVMPGKAAIFAKQLRQQKLTQRVWSTLFLFSDAELKDTFGALEGASFVAPKVSTDFRAAFAAQHGDSASLIYAAAFSDLGQILDDCATRKERVVACLAKLRQYPGAIGMIDYVNDRFDRFLSFPFVRHEVVGQGFRAYE